MRIVHLTTEYPPLVYGGLGTAVGGLVSASVRAGLDIGVLLFESMTMRRGYGGLRATGVGSASGRFRRGPAKIMELSFEEDLAWLANSLAEAKPDLLHLHSFWLGWHALQLRELLGIPLVYTVHSLDRAEYEIGEGPAECVTQWVQQEEVINGADRVIALSQDELALIGEYCPAARHKVRVVGNGIDDLPARGEHLRGRQPVVLFAGRFVERKGLWDLLHAICLIEPRMSGLRYVLAGGHRGCSPRVLEAWLFTPELRRLGADIEFTGWLSPEEMAAQYARADILVVPSWYEPFGMVVLEAMLHGVAVAASAVGGPAEILEHGRTGCLFAPHDSAALAECIVELAGNSQKRRRIARAGARAVRKTWLWPTVMDRMHDVYCELVM